MIETIAFLLKNAEIDVVQFDNRKCREIGIYNRVLKSFYMMTYVKQGSAKLRVGNMTYLLRAGSVIFIPPNLEHDQYKDTDDETTFLWWHFTYKIEKSIDVLALFDIPHCYSLHESGHFESVFDQLMRPNNHVNYITETIYQKAKSLELLSILLDSALQGGKISSIPTSSTQFMSLLCKMIQHIDANLTLEEMANELHLNKTYISLRFKQLFGTSPIHMHRHLKLERAKVLLTLREMSVTEIGEALGFTEVAHFSRFFKMGIGISPKNYRNNSI